MTNPVIENSFLTISQRVTAANAVLNDWSSANVFVAIGHENVWSQGDMLVEVPNQSTNYINGVFRNMVAMKRITGADMALVIPRVDWVANVSYAQYDSAVDMFTTNQYNALDGTVTVDSSRSILGTNTSFTSELASGDFIYLPGDGELVAPQMRQVVDVFNDTSMNVNTAFDGIFVSNTVFQVQDQSPDFANVFYVRNSYDQIFKCLYNNGGVASTQMPMISIGGNLPENPYIITSDGYKWKYMYTIPSGQKQKFFTPDWMPVYVDPVVAAAAVDGRLDIIEIINGGTGYNDTVASNTATIISIAGDGFGANVSAQVDENGTIFNTNVLNPGQGYTYANVIISPGDAGTNANLYAIIGPPGGHGSNPYEELGATSLMLSMDLDATENGTIPTSAQIGPDYFTYRQVVVVREPQLAASNTGASNLNYNVTVTINTQTLPAGQYFFMDETVYQGTSLESATFQATVVFWDSVNSIMYLNDVIGEFQTLAPIRGTQQTIPVTAFILTEPTVQPFTGDILYINNLLPIPRSNSQTEQLVVVLEF